MPRRTHRESTASAVAIGDAMRVIARSAARIDSCVSASGATTYAVRNPGLRHFDRVAI
jgi:hypothetical protein